MIGNPAIGRMMLITFLAGSAFMGIESIFGLWTQARFDWGPHEIGWAFALSGVAAAICQIYVTYPLSRTFGQAPMLAVGLVLAALCMALHELVTNSLKYGALSASGGKVFVSWTLPAEGEIDFLWREEGGPAVAPPDHSGFGTRLIKNAVVHDLQGGVEHALTPDGLHCVITVALP